MGMAGAPLQIGYQDPSQMYTDPSYGMNAGMNGGMAPPMPGMPPQMPQMQQGGMYPGQMPQY